MCPQASGAGAKYAYLDHDTDRLHEVPPVRYQWYTVFDAEDVRLLWCCLYQTNDEVSVQEIEIKWTIDGNVYFLLIYLSSGIDYYVFRDHNSSNGGTAGLEWDGDRRNACFSTDKRGHSFKVEVRIITFPDTNQELWCDCVRETLEQT